MSNPTTLTLNSKLTHAQGVFWQDVVGDVVILDPNGGQYFGLENTSAAIWQMLEEPTPLHQVCDQLQADYEVDRETCERHVLAFSEDLYQANLVVLIDSSSA